MNRIYRQISLPLEILLIIMALVGGWKLLWPQIEGQVSFHSLWLVVLFILSILIHYLIQKSGFVIGGLIGGRKLIAFRIGKTNYVREKDQFCVREPLPEQELLSVIMTRKNEHSVFSWFCYLYGNVLCDFLLTLICFLLLRNSFFSPQSHAFVFLFAFYFSGIITLIISAIPLYRTDLPNSALVLLKLLLNHAYFHDLRALFAFLRKLSEESLTEEDGFLDEVEENSFSGFAGYYYYHLYEKAVWDDSFERANEILMRLYQHRNEYSEELQIRIQQESIGFLALYDIQNSLTVADLFFNEQSIRQLATSSYASASRCLALWSRIRDDMMDQSDEYQKQCLTKLQNIPFKQAREGWMGIIQHGQI